MSVLQALFRHVLAVPPEHFLLNGFQNPYRLDANRKSGIFINVKIFIHAW